MIVVLQGNHTAITACTECASGAPSWELRSFQWGTDWLMSFWWFQLWNISLKLISFLSHVQSPSVPSQMHLKAVWKVKDELVIEKINVFLSFCLKSTLVQVYGSVKAFSSVVHIHLFTVFIVEVHIWQCIYRYITAYTCTGIWQYTLLQVHHSVREDWIKYSSNHGGCFHGLWHR